MTEKNAVKSETVSLAREFSKQFLVCGQIFAATNDPQNTQPVTLEEVLDAYDAHLSQAIGAAAKEAAEKGLYTAYLLGCEDECIPEPKTFECFMETWNRGVK